MYKTNKGETKDCISVDIEQLQTMLGVGKNTADKIGKEAKAVLYVGRRKLFNVRKIEEYINSLSEV